jgi:hypothetical protein
VKAFARKRSGFQNLAEAVLISRWKQGYWFMATIGTAAYFDESRVDPSHKVAVVAGFVATTDMWIGFEKKWAALISDKPAKLPWKNYVQRNSIPFAKLARTYSLKAINFPLRQDSFPLFPARRGSDRTTHMVNIFSSAYSACSFVCCALLDAWAADRQLRKCITPVKVVFDHGTPHQIHFERGYIEYYKSRPETYLSRVPLFEDDNTILPLQAAHLYAWLLSRAHNGTGRENKALEIINRQGHVMQEPPKLRRA